MLKVAMVVRQQHGWCWDGELCIDYGSLVAQGHPWESSMRGVISEWKRSGRLKVYGKGDGRVGRRAVLHGEPGLEGLFVRVNEENEKEA